MPPCSRSAWSPCSRAWHWGSSATQAADDRDHDLGLAGASRVTAVDDYADRARAVTLLASHSAAFANFYQAPGTRSTGSTGRTGGPT